jgi:isoleucyl-tRNA synthetase
MSNDAEKRSYKKTLNLPKTAFPMKANLVQNEPASLKRWAKLGLYQKLREQAAAARDAGNPKHRFVFHDGPPYANGSIHLGHLLNKVLKDIVVRTRTMMGFDVPYIPGWDCHGLPIEHKVMQEQRDSAPPSAPDSARGDTEDPSGGAAIMKTRRACKKYAEKFVKLQSQQMQRLLTLADYDDPYLTMNPRYEAATLEVFAAMVARGVVYRGLKPVHWSIENQTALAEAELEYYDREDTSVFVKFDVRSAMSDVPGDAALMIWTTTPWTLPANLAVAVSPRAEYGVYHVKGKPVIVATDLAAKVFAAEGVEAGEPTRIIPGSELVGTTYAHPFLDDQRERSVVPADYVTLEDGTGLVHTAPGHGVEDYQTGLREGLDIYCPVQHDGTFDGTAPDWLRGKSVWEANDLVVERLKQSGHLFHSQKFMHSYPHDWRGKTPVIFRATEQWFVDVDKTLPGDEAYGGGKTIRELALEVTETSGRHLTEHGSGESPQEYWRKVDRSVVFYPGWGRNRMRGMLETRPDWCLSRQRAWGLPIPAFYTPGSEDNDGGTLLTEKSVRAVAEFIREKGSDAWFAAPPEAILEKYNPDDDPDADDNIDKATLIKGNDIFDVWFESGSSWYACMMQRGLAHDPAQSHPVTDLYLEGSDQHRGWFQLSLLPCLTVTGQPPFRSVLTHGFMVDKDGRKMSKSLGNALEVEELLKNYGADVCRWWVSSLNTDNDIKVDESFFKLAGEEYRKVRNTLRFMLSNLSDFDASDPNRQDAEDARPTLEDWLRGELKKVSDIVCAAYQAHQYRKAHETLFNFCNDTLSAMYLAAVKDRLYCDAPDSPRRGRAQAALHQTTATITKLLAPLLPHTADEAWRVLRGDEGCVHLECFETIEAPAAAAHWQPIMAARDRWLKALEEARQSRDIDNPLDCGLRVPVPAKAHADAFDPNDLADLCGVSRFAFEASLDAPAVDDLRDEPRCERSWKRDGTVKQRSDGGMLSDRDAAALGLA